MSDIKCRVSIEVTCSRCGSKNTVTGSHLEFEEVERDEREMGAEIHHAAEWSGKCSNCNEPVVLKVDVREYRIGAINGVQTKVEGGSFEEDLNDVAISSGRQKLAALQ